MPTGEIEKPRVITDSLKIEELLTRGVAEVLPNIDNLRIELESGRRLTAYMGIDPTAPDMHVGHESQLLRMRRLQELGHNVILLIGDFTAMIGDPSDKQATRTRLTHDQVLQNSNGYKEQAGKILDFDSSINPIQLRYNSEWFNDMTFGEVLQLASEFTVQQMLERDMFRKRMDEGKPLSVVEMIYPMMQAWDSVIMDVDIELGGSDQIFNMLAGSTLIKRYRAKQKYVIAGQLLADPDGKKIGKSEGNMITLNDGASDMFHKIMLWGDNITPHALELCTDMPMEEINELAEKLASGELSGLEGKTLLARRIVTDLHSREAAVQAEADYGRMSSKKMAEIDPATLDIVAVKPGSGIIDLIIISGLASSKSQARRLVESGAVRINDEKVGFEWFAPVSSATSVLRVGRLKRENHRLILIDGEASNE